MSRIIQLAILVSITSTFTGCEAIGDIFKAGIWVGIIVIIAIVAVIAFIAKMFRK